MFQPATGRYGAVLANMTSSSGFLEEQRKEYTRQGKISIVTPSSN
jgi:hypothetical protein